MSTSIVIIAQYLIVNSSYSYIMEDGLDTIMQSEDPDREVEVDEENLESDVEEIVESQTKRGPPVHTAWRDAFDLTMQFAKIARIQ